MNKVYFGELSYREIVHAGNFRLRGNDVLTFGFGFELDNEYSLKMIDVQLNPASGCLYKTLRIPVEIMPDT